MTAERAIEQPQEARPRARGSGVLILGFATLLFVGTISALVTSAALELQMGAANYLAAHGRWSRGRADAAQALYAYATTGEGPELRRARARLEVPLAFRRARRALEASPSDPAAARAGFLQAGIDEADAGRMIRFHEMLAATPIMRRALELWRQTDEAILHLRRVADELEAAFAGGADAERIEALRRELSVANATLQPQEIAFARSVDVGLRRLRTTLLWVVPITFLVMATIAAAFITWAYRHVRLSERNLRATFAQAAVGMARLDPGGRFLEANDAFCRLLGVSRPALVGSTLTGVLHPDDLPRHGRLRALAESGGGSGADRRFVRADGTIVWVRMTVSEIELGGGGEHLFMIVEDVGEARRLAEELDYRARHDTLTGLINRFEIERRLASAVASVDRHGEPHTLCFLDLDQFKIVNDTSGHDAGDHLLRQVASLLARSVRANDTVGRLGGDEFAVLLDHAGLDEARRVVEGLRQALADHDFHWEDRVYDVSCSIGFVEITPDGSPPGTWLRKADIACYLAKEAGRNRAHAYVEGDEALVERQDQMAWVGRIREAIAQDRLTLHAQRIVPIEGPSAPRYELLLRVEDSDGRTYGPDAFLPAAERYGLATELDRWVTRTVLATLARHPEHVATLGRCHVNLSAHAISDGEFRAFLLAALDEFGVPAERLCFEITETAVIRSLTDALALIEALRARGCSVALDDFGTGLSSFGHLKSLPVDLVKIDGSFVRDMVGSDLDRTIVRSVHEVARVLGRETIAEYVEDEEIRGILRGIGVDHLQGRAVHTPEPWEVLLREGGTRAG